MSVHGIFLELSPAFFDRLDRKGMRALELGERQLFVRIKIDHQPIGQIWLVGPRSPDVNFEDADLDKGNEPFDILDGNIRPRSPLTSILTSSSIDFARPSPFCR